MNPRQALQVLDNVGANYQRNRQDHVNIQQAVMMLRAFIEQHDPLEPKNNGASTPANENHEQSGQKLRKK